MRGKFVIAVIFAFLLLPYFASAAPWWNSSWGYRMPINITNNNLSQTLEQNYTINVTFNHSALVQAGKSLASGNDTRIVWYNSSSGQNIELDRVNTTMFNNATNLTVLWFKLQRNISANASDTNYYVYYGNPSAGVAPANGSNVFLLYDSWEDGNYNANPAWTVGSASYVSVVTSPVYDGTYSLQITYQNTGNEWADINITPTPSIIYETWWRDNGSPDLYDEFFNSTGYEVVGIHADGGSSNCVANNGGNFNSMGSVSIDTWYRLKLVYDGSTVSCYRYNIDGTLHGSSVGNSITNPNNKIQRIRLSGGGFPNGHNLIHDMISARKYLSPEPSAVLGAEEIFPKVSVSGSAVYSNGRAFSGTFRATIKETGEIVTNSTSEGKFSLIFSGLNLTAGRKYTLIIIAMDNFTSSIIEKKFVAG